MKYIKLKYYTILFFIVLYNLFEYLSFPIFYAIDRKVFGEHYFL